MAARATKDAVQRAVDGPDYDAALAIINGRIADAKESQSAASGRASQGWGDVEKLGVNKRGAQMFSRVQAIDDETERQDQLRTFFELCKLEGIGVHVDLVDQAQGKTEHPVPTQPAAAAPPPPPPAPPGDTDLVAAAEPIEPTDKLDKAPAKRGAGRPDLKVVAAARDAAKKHLGTAPDALD